MDATPAHELERLRLQALDGIVEGVSITALDTGLIVYTNEAEDQLFGYERGGLIGQHVSVQNAYAPDENQRLVTSVMRQLHAEGHWEGEWLNRKKDGTPFYTFARITTVEVDARKYAVCVQQDVTRSRLEALDELLPTLVGVLDVRDVFERLSTVARKVLPHDLLALPVLAENKREVEVYAVAGNVARFPERVPLPEHNRPLLTEPWEYQLFDDVQLDPLAKTEPTGQAGYRSLLRVPIRLNGELVAAIDFASMTPGFYIPADVLVARRIADHVALALSHQRLAEESRRRTELEQQAVSLERRRAEATQRADEATARALRLESRVRSLIDELDSRAGFRRVIGSSPSWRQVLTQATQVAATDTTVLLLGESGTGKEVVARFVHHASSRRDGPFIALNCAALPEQLLEAELFGYERGAFTGATQSKPGQLEQAAGGTLFLDEVGEMSLSAQAKFLRVLQEREFQRLGGTRVLRTDVRIIAATNRNLRKAIGLGDFREDLFYRLDVFAIRLPPLRERRDDVLPLSEAFIEELGRVVGRPPAGISRDARKSLVEHEWPGNVRELRNVLERAAILCDGGLITTEHLAINLLPSAALPERADAPPAAAAIPAAAGPVGAADLASMERAMIEQALQTARFNKSKAASALGMTRAQLYVRMRKYGIE